MLVAPQQPESRNLKPTAPATVLALPDRQPAPVLQCGVLLVQAWLVAWVQRLHCFLALARLERLIGRTHAPAPHAPVAVWKGRRR